MSTCYFVLTTENEENSIYFEEFEMQAFLNVLHSCKKEASDLCTGVQIKAKCLSWHEIVGQLCDVRLHENEFYATKITGYFNSIFIHLSFIYRETDGFMPELPIVSISGHLFWSALSLVYWPLAQWAWPNLDLGLCHLFDPTASL